MMRLDVYIHDCEEDEKKSDSVVRLLEDIKTILTKLYTEFHFIHHATTATITAAKPVEQ